MKGLVALALLVVASAFGQPASAPAPEKACLPSSSVSIGLGTVSAVFETADVKGRVGWCPSNGGGYYIATHYWCLRSVCDKAPLDAWSKAMAALDRVVAASSPAAQLGIEWATASVPLQTDLERWQFNDWRYQACQWLTSTQPGVTPRPPMPIAIPNSAWVAPLTYCDPWAPGVKPGVTPPPPPPVVAWVVAPAAANANPPGTRPTYRFTPPSTIATDGGRATSGAACDCATGAVINGNQYCSVGGLATKVALCVKAP